MKNILSVPTKRICFLLFMFAALIACKDKNAPDIPSGDYNVAKKASKNVVSILGKDKASAEKAILKAGFRKMEVTDYNAPQRVFKLTQRAKGDEEEVYVYNITEQMEDMRDEEMVNAIIDSKKTAIIFIAIYNNGILMNINGKMIVGAEIDNVNKLYLDCSANLHSNITMLGSWQGSVTDTENDNDASVEYTNYNKFYNAVAPLNSVFAQEAAGCALDMTGMRSFGYAVTWNKPNEREARFQINNEGYKTAIAEAGFSITYMDYSNMDF